MRSLLGYFQYTRRHNTLSSHRRVSLNSIPAQEISILEWIPASFPELNLISTS
jgi:hypothetical protein